MNFHTEGFWDEEEGRSTRQSSGSGYLFDGAIRTCNGEILHVIQLDADRRIAVCEVIDPTLLGAPEKWRPPLPEIPRKEVPYDALKPLTPQIARLISIWPPLPTLFSKGARTHAAPPSPLREPIVETLEAVTELAQKFMNTRKLQDSFLVSPPGDGAPRILWLRDGVPIAGFEVSVVGEAPRYVHSSDCQGVGDSAASGGKTRSGINAANRAVNKWIGYVDSVRVQRARLIDDNSHSDLPLSPGPLVRIYINQNCSCSLIAVKPNAVTELSCVMGKKISEVIGRAEYVFKRRLEASESQHNLTAAQLQQLAGRLVRYGMTRPTNEPRPINERAIEELRQMMNLKSAVAIRFGPAGSGKTSLLAGIAARESRKGKRVLIVTFTSAAREVVQERIETRTRAVRHNVQCKMLTELLPRRIKKRVLIGSRNSDEALGASHFSKMFTDSQGSQEQLELRNVDVLLVDEAEDLLPEHWKYLFGPGQDPEPSDEANDYERVVIAYDDAQSVLSTTNAAPRTFEYQGPAEWASGLFTKPAGETNKGLLRSRWSEIKPDARWLRFNLRQTGVLESHSTKHRRSFRPQDREIDTGLDVSKDTDISEKVTGSLDEAINLALDIVFRNPDCLVVSETRLLNMVLTLSVDKPNSQLCQEVFIESPYFNFAKQRGERTKLGVFLEAPLPFDMDYLKASATAGVEVLDHPENEEDDNGDKYDEPENEEDDNGDEHIATTDGVTDENQSQPSALCDRAHQQLWSTFSAMRGQIRPLDTRARLLTIPAARGYEANTAIVFVPNPVDARNFSSESEYVAITRPQERLIKIVLPTLSTIGSEQSSHARVWRALKRLRADQDLRGGLWPLVQVDLDRWVPDEDHIELLEEELPKKVLEWYGAFQKAAADLIKKYPRAPIHCLPRFGPKAGAPLAPGMVNREFDYAKWVGDLVGE